MVVFIPQAADKRQPVVPAPVSTAAAAAAKLLPSSQAVAVAAGKLGFHVGQSASPAASSPSVQASGTAAAAVGGAGILPAKKPPISRGVPPPVPPNKPVVPPKKEAAVYLRRSELQSQSAPQQDAVKYGKQPAPSHGVASTTASGTAPPMQTQQPASTTQAAPDEQVSKTAELK